MFLEPHFKGQRSGWIEVICGSMFSGKTEELIRRLKRAKIARQRVEIFKPALDSRYGQGRVASHDDNHLLATPIEHSSELLRLGEGVDVVGIDEDGYVTILGRVKRFAKIAGEMVSLELVERIAYNASPAHKHAATVEQVSGSGESTVLFTTDATLDRMTLVKAARQLGAQDLAVARRIVKVGSLPLLGSGKTDYVTLHNMTLKSA